MEKNKVIYVSPVRYPTEKAYGITIKYTMASLENQGFEIRIVDPVVLINQVNPTRVDARLHRQLIKRFKRGKYSRHNFNLLRLLVALNSLSQFRDCREILWTRDPLIAMVIILFRQTAHTIVEIHQNPHVVDKILLRLLNFKNTTILAPISLALQSKIENSRLSFNMTNVILCPMGVPDKFLEAATPRAQIDCSSVKVAYVGGLYSNGVDQGIKDIIRLVLDINRATNSCQFELKLYGISESEEDELSTLFSKHIHSKVISSERRQIQSDLIPKLLKCDIFLLPYPKGDFFEARFPLKALEYAALQRPIVASDTTSHRNIFREDEVFYFNLNSKESFHKALIEAARNRDLASSKVELAYAKARDYSYTNRVRIIVQHIRNK
jgi:glycosyltransferase involved in cell wall biosynthesis